VAEEVERLGYRAVPWVGSSSFRMDLGVVDPEDPGRFIMGVMCDGDNYRSASTSRDRDRLRLQVLESLGWRIHRIWSPDWVQRHETEVRRLGRALRDAGKGPKKVVAKKERVSPKRNEVKKVKVEEASSDELPEVEPYRFVNLKPKHLFSRYSPEHRERYLRQYHSEVRRLLPQLVRAEGPVHVDLAFRRMNNAFRLRRATQSFREAFNEEVEKAGKRSITVREVFLWPRNLDKVRVRVPVEGVKESFRPIEHIPPEEMKQAMLLVAGHSLGLKEGSFLDAVARLLGFKRMGANILDLLRSVYEKAREDGALVLEDGLVILVGTSNE
jgi:hypothetical protein